MTLARSFVRSVGRSRRRLLPVAALAALIFTAAGAGLFNGNSATADTGTINFNSYSLGSIHGQDGWSSLGSTGGGCAVYDHAVVQQQYVVLGNALRLSNAVTSGCFGDQTFSRSLVDEAGETSAVNNGWSGGTRQNRFESEFTLASVVPSAQQPGLFISVSPDRGDGARMSYLGFEDQADGIHVLFYDYQDHAPFGTILGDAAGCGAEDDFILTDIATVNRSLAHTIKFDMGFVDGSRNDTVKVYVDGNLEITGTSWEDYYRYCEGNPTRPVDSLLFRSGGTPAPATAGNGYLVDDMTSTTSTSASTTTVTAVTASSMTAAGWVFYNDETDVVDPTLGSFVAGPGTPDYPTGSAQISVTGTQRRNLATYQFSGTPLANITTLRFRTYNPSAGNGGPANRAAYLNFNVDFNGSDTFQRRLVYVPRTNGTVVQNTWQEWDAIGFGTALWTYSGNTWPVTGGSGTTPKTWAQILADYPGVRIRVTDAFVGLRVGEPYADGYTENIDTFTFGTASGTTIFNFENTPACTSVCYVNATTGNDAFDGSTPTSAKKTIQGGINAVSVGGTVHVAAGTYSEDVAANKAGVQLLGAGIDVSTIVGPIGGAGSGIQVTAAGVVVDGFTITRAGNNTTDWNNPALNTAGLAVQGQGNTVELRYSKLTGNRTGVDINNANGNSIHHNIIDNNRTGMIFRNQTDSTLVVNNFITNNWTVGVLFLDGSGGTNVPPQSAALSSFSDNNISGNWYGNAEDRQAGGSVPPAPTNPKNFEFNWWGTTAVTVSTVQGGEPGYSAQIPVIFGGTATPPGGQPEIKGTSSANIDYIQFQCSGVDTSAAIGFQPAGTLCNPPAVTNVTASTMTATGWVFYNDETDVVDATLGSFVAGPGIPDYPTGSAQISVTGTQRRNLASYQFAGTPLANITALRFRTYNPSAGNGGPANRSAYLNFNVDFNGSDTFQRRLVFVPSVNGTVVQNAWQDWDAISGGTAKWSYSGPTWPVTGGAGTTPKTWAQILADYPGVRIRVTDAFVGLRVGEPYADGYTENIDTFTFGTASGTTIFNFENTPACTSVCYVNATTGNDAFDGSTPTSAKKTIQGGINAVSVGGTVHVAAGTYSEDVAANKAGVQLLGAGIDVSTIVGPIGGAGSGIQVTAAGVVVDGFTITRAGNNTTDWNNPALNTAGLAVQGQGNTVELRYSKLTGNRTGVDINNANGNSIHHNIIDNNRTGMIFRNQTDSTLVVNNFITNNWTVGVLFLDGSGGTNVPPQSAALSSFSDNNISGNWYGNAEDRQAGGSVPPAPTNPKNFEFNWWGTTAVTVSTVQGGEPGYAAQIPVISGGTATPPGGQPEIKGTSSANIDYIQFQCSGVDTSPAIGFQPAGTLCNPPSVTEVTAATMNSLGWVFYNDETDTISPTLGSFVTGPGTPPYGTGSAQISVTGTQRRNLATNVGAGTPLANITALRFRTYNPSAGNGGSATRSAYLNFNVDFNGSDTYQRRLVYVPSQNGTVIQNSWQEWDAINNGNSLWQYSGPTWPVTGQPGTTLKTWSQILADYPLVRIRFTQAFVGLRVGEPYPDGYTENIDTFTFGTASGTTIFDFEKNDDDADGLEDILDNCPTVNNPGQENTNGEPMPLPKPYPIYDDATNPAGDFVGDACDGDIDGDNVPNLIETMLGLSPYVWDSDGDRTNDGTEIQCGTNPLSAVSNLSGPDTDNDRIPNACEPAYGTNPAMPDTDGDGVRDGVEIRYWMSNPLAVNTDGDSCRDGREVASVNHDHTVNPADLGTIASLFGTLSPQYRPLDSNGDGVINPADLGFVASQYGACTP